MALRGNLRDFSVTQLLNLINLARKTGTLILDGPSDQAYVAFRNGKLAYARIGAEDGGLATILRAGQQTEFEPVSDPQRPRGQHERQGAGPAA